MTEEEKPQKEGIGITTPFVLTQHVTEETAKKLIGLLEGSYPVQRIRASQLLSGLLATASFAMLIVAIERMVINWPIGWLLIFSLSGLSASGLLLTKLAGRE